MNFLEKAWNSISGQLDIGDAVTINFGGGEVSATAVGRVTTGSRPPATAIERTLGLGVIAVIVVVLFFASRR